MIRKITTSLCFLISTSSFAQNDTISLTLGESIELAIENNLDLVRAQLGAETSRVNLRQSRANLLPSLNASFSGGVNNGRSIDPFTNAYIEEQLTYSNAGLGLSANVFNGFRIKNSIQRDRFNLQASEMETEEAKQNLVLNVTLAYLQILNNRDLVTLAKLRMQTTERQIERVRELYDEGAGNPVDYTDIQGQYANDKTGLTRALNALTASMLQLSQLLNVTYEVAPETAGMTLVDQDYRFTSEEVFEDALENLATFEARRLRIRASEKEVSVAKSLYSPQIFLFGQLNTNFSSAARLYNEAGSFVTETDGFVTIGDENFPVFMNETRYGGEDISFYDQLNNNLNSVVGVGVDIPLFNGFRARNNVALQKIRLREARVDLESVELQFRQAIKQAHADMVAAREQYRILEEQVEAFTESYRVNEIRYNSGVSNMVAYIISKNNLDNAQINLANARYEFLLRVKVLEYYRGNM